MPIPCIKLIATAPMNMLEAEIYEFAYILLAFLGFTGIVMALSTLYKSNFAALLSSLAIIFVPMAISQYLPFGVQKLLDLIPLVGSPTDIFRTNFYHIGGKIIWSPYLLMSVPLLIGVLCVPFILCRWSKRLKS